MPRSVISKRGVEDVLLDCLRRLVQKDTVQRVDAHHLYTEVARHTYGSQRVSDMQRAWADAQKSFPRRTAAWQLLDFCHMYSTRIMLSTSTKSKETTEKHAVGSWRKFKSQFKQENMRRLRLNQPNVIGKENRGLPTLSPA